MKKHVIKKHNAGKGCFVCGVNNPFGLHTDFYELEDGTLAAKVTPSEHHQSYPGRLHGGVSAALLDETIGRAKIAVAEAKVLTTEVALAAANKLFELAGTRSTLGVHNLDRFWRDARTHTLHDPVRWKFHAVGQYYLNGVRPPLHSWI